MRFRIARAAALLALVALPAWAGEYEKCTLSTQACLDKMAEKMRNAGFVGVELDMDPKTGQSTVKRVFEGSPAAAANIQPGDVLYALNGVVISDANKEALAAAKKEWKPGQLVTYTIRRKGADRDVSVTLAPVPSEVMARWIGEHMLQHAAVSLAETAPEAAAAKK